MGPRCVLLDLPIILSSLLCSKWLHVSDLCQLDSACCQEQQRRSLMLILGNKGTTLNGVDFIANAEFMKWLSARRASVDRLDYDGATDHLSFALVSDRTCGNMKSLRLNNVCGDEARAFLYRSSVLTQLTVSKLRKTSKRRVVVASERKAHTRCDCCPLLTNLTLREMTTIPSELITCLLGRKIHTLVLQDFGSFSKEFANIAADRLVNLRTLSITNTKELTDSRLARVLKACTGLTSLDLSYCAMLGTATVASLAEHCPDLVHLRISHIRSHEEGFDAAFTNMAKCCCRLQTLKLEYVQITDASLVAVVQHMMHLVTLEATNCYELRGQGTIQPDPHAVSRLETIKFKNCNQLLNVMNICQVCPLLRVLDLAESPWIAYGALTHILKYGSSLESLALSSHKTYGRDLDMLAAGSLPKLRVMNLSSSAITDEGLGYICAICPNIQVLCLDNCWELTNDGLLHLGVNCPHLEVLSMNKEPNITEIGLMSAVSSAAALRVLVFSLEVNMTHTALIALAHLDLRQVQTLAIAGFRFNGLFMQALMSLVDNSPALRSLYLDATCSFPLLHSPTPCDDNDKNAFVAMLLRIYPNLRISTETPVDKLSVLEM